MSLQQQRLTLSFAGRSEIDFLIHQNMGLVGGLLVTRAAEATADGRPNDTDIEFVVMFHVSLQLCFDAVSQILIVSFRQNKTLWDCIASFKES